MEYFGGVPAASQLEKISKAKTATQNFLDDHDS
jgi:hypothetical protein